MKKLLNWIKSKESDFVLFVIFLILLNLVSVNCYKKFDLTKTASYSLSNASKTLVKNLEEPLSILVFFDEDQPAPYNSVTLYIKDLLGEYKASGNKNFKLNFLDMKKEDNQRIAQGFGIQPIQDQILTNNEVSFKLDYRGIAITYGDSVELIDQISSSDGFEYLLTSKLTKMIASSDLLASLHQNEKIKVNLFMTDTMDKVSPGICDSITEIVEEGFDELNKQQQKRMSFESRIISQDSEEIEKYGIPGARLRTDEGIITLAVGVVVTSGDNFRVVPVQIENSVFGMSVTGLDTIPEYLTQAIQSLLLKPTQIGYITGHGEAELDNNQYGAASLNNLISESYETVPLNLSEQDIPLSMNCIIVNGPEQFFTQEELFKIDQFIMKGGNVLFFTNSFIEIPGQNQYTPSQFVENKINLDDLLATYGVKKGYDVVLDPNCAKNQRTGTKAYFMPLLNKKQMNKNHPISKNLGFIYMYLNSSLDVSQAMESKDVKVSVLAKTTKDSWAEPIASFAPSYQDMYPGTDAVYGEQNLAVILEGKFKSYFTKPIDEDSSFISSSRLPGKIFVMSSSFATRSSFIQGNGSSVLELFLLNAIDYMNNNEDFCVMRSKGLSLDTLDIKSQGFAVFMRYLNQFGLVVLVVIAGIIVWRLRTKRREKINEKYNPDDARVIVKTSARKTKKDEKAE